MDTQTAISVSKQSVEQLLSAGKETPFVIPEYQRPYAWTEEEVETLFEDIWEFTETKGGTSRNGTYFLGSIVSYKNQTDNGQEFQEIIDGQQRITSLFLLLRAIYTNLEKADEKTEEALNFIRRIEPTIWRTNKLTGKVDYSNILLTSNVINNDGNEILRNILKTGEVNPNAKDNYSMNYRYFQKLFEKHAKENPLMIYEFIYALLDQAILLPISAGSQDTALDIFSTLNNRGLPLSDADIFKAKIYNHLNTEKDKNEFIEKWKDIEEKATYASENIQQLFYYYMFYLRALEKDDKSTTPGVRKYYSYNKFSRLLEPNLLTNIEEILNIWKVVNKNESIDNEKWSTNKDICKILDMLSSYPNEYWKYPVIIYYLSHKNKENFENTFLKFLHKLFVELLTKYLVFPTINAVKTSILKLNVEIINSMVPSFNFKNVEEISWIEKIKVPNIKATRMLLKILAYNKQDNLLPDKWEIEHIFPQKWQTNYFSNIDANIIKEKIEHIGNKLPFEKKLNIIAGNGYFNKKKIEYEKSTIAITNEMAYSTVVEWELDNITERDIRISDEIKNIIEKWNNEYSNLANKASENKPTQEDLLKIEQFKINGWI